MSKFEMSQHIQTFEDIRRLCIVCLGLDLCAEKLFKSPQDPYHSQRTVSSFRAALSSNLLHLAIALRINIYQGQLRGAERKELPWWGSAYTKANPVIERVTLKDICDKIIHADNVTVPYGLGITHADTKPCLHLEGTYRQQEWVMDVPIEPLAQYALSVLDEIDAENA